MAKPDDERRRSSPDKEAQVRQAFRLQAEWCRNLGSPFTGLLCELAAERLDRSTGIGETILDWPGDPDSKADSVPLRFAGALNGLVRKGLLPDLARLYPPNPLPDGEVLWPKVVEALAAAEANIGPWLALPPQTNEVGRSSILFAGLCWLWAHYPLPIHLYEVGASAGLNLNLDRYSYRFGEDVLGAMGAALFLTPSWEGGTPPNLSPRVVSRSGCDLSPLDTTLPKDRERLVAYVWPDQADRVKRLTAALAIAARHPVKVERSDAAQWVERTVAATAAWGEQQVLFHSIAFQYFPKDSQERIIAHMERAGAGATRDSPLAWLRFEADPEMDKAFSLRLRVWPGEDHLLALGDPHGRWVKWLAA
ncbi:DUF2332 domain-containing protein [Taklimakanibacter deserti]|uniref:DUF2332 domain-containing protein n=1 Tax=Taklimakanibacter deserti TaxID=2267839 RepID=UPI000E64BB6B